MNFKKWVKSIQTVGYNGERNVVHLAQMYLQPHLRQWVFWQCLPLNWTTIRGKNCRHLIAVMEVVDLKLS